MRKQPEEFQPENSKPERDVKPVPLIKQNIILEHVLNKARLKSDAERLKYEADRAVGEFFEETNWGKNSVGEGKNAADDVLEAIYGLIESGEIYLAEANRILKELKKPLQKSNDRLRKKLPRNPKPAK